MPVSTIGGLLGGFDLGRQRNEERRKEDHRMALEKAQESRMRELLDFNQAVELLKMQEGATPDTIGGRQAVAGKYAPEILPPSTGAGASPARVSAAPSETSAPAPAPANRPALGGLLSGMGATPAAPALPRSLMQMSSPAAASDTAQPSKVDRPAGMKAAPASPAGYDPSQFGSMAAYRDYTKANAEHEVEMKEIENKSMAQDIASRSIRAEMDGGPKLGTRANEAMTARFGSLAKALDAQPKDFYLELAKIKNQFYEENFTDEQIMARVQPLVDAYAANLEAKAAEIEARGKVTDDERLWLTSLRQEQTAFKQHIAESLGLKFSIEPGMGITFAGIDEGDPRLAAYNDMVNRYISFVTVGDSGILVADRAVSAFQGQENYPDLQGGGRPNAPQSVDSALGRGTTVTWLNGDQTVKDPDNGKIYTIKKNGDIIDWAATKGGEGMVPGMVQPDQTIGPDPRQPQLQSAAEWLNNGGK